MATMFNVNTKPKLSRNNPSPPITVRPLGQITADMELLLEEMTDEHELQHGEVLALVKMWLDVHAQHALEKYVSGGSPILYYGPYKK